MVAATLAISWLLSGGVVKVEYWRLPSQTYSKGQQPLIVVAVIPSKAESGIPFVWQRYRELTPFDLRLTYSTRSAVDRCRLNLKRFDVVFDDGDTLDLLPGISPPVQLAADLESQQRNRVREEGLRAWRSDIILKRCIDKPYPFTLHVAGQLASGALVIDRFDLAFRVVPTYQCYTMTTWQWLLRQSA
jgi:hypothetical protein